MFLSELCETTVFTKLDFQQASGSFKERGARNALMQLPKAAHEKGVIAASAGNHALALAWHGKQLGIPVTCIMPMIAPLTKVEKCRKFGANVVLEGAHIGESREFAKKNFPDLPYM
jgi:threonine dehydratase